MASFLEDTPELEDMNQYWYSPATIEALVAEIESSHVAGERIAFLSTPSIYFSLAKGGAARSESWVFDYDRQWEGTCDHFKFYDYNDAEGSIADASLHGSFDVVVVDPPFITRDVWSLYADAVALLLNPEGSKRCILTTVGENEAMLREILGPEVGAPLRKTRFMPAMQNSKLPYQYSLYVNYVLEEASPLNTWNADVPLDFEEANAIRMEDAREGGEASGVAQMGKGERALGGTKLSFEELMEREMAREAAGGGG
jgi:hypothetical protein|tara:strand:- start:852 stop:1619 length:768 start_codon:yes stop_codon:yes gene_type:complete